MRQLAVVFLCWVALSAAPLHGAIVLEAGNHTLLPNTANQPINVFVTGNDLIFFFSLTAELGDGIGPNPEPIFNSFDFTGSVLDVPGASTAPGPLSGFDQYASGMIFLDGSSPGVPANGLLVRLNIDTTGIDEGTYPLLLAMTDFGLGSEFRDQLGEPLFAEIRDGSVTVALPALETPEPPASWLWVALAIPLGVMMWRRRANRTAAARA